MAKKISGLREKNKMATRRELSQFGIELFLKQGFTNTTIDQIVEPLGIGKRTFFRYFDTKDDLVFAWYEELTSNLVDELRSRPKEEKPFDAVCETLSSLLKMYDDNPNWARKMMRLTTETPALIGKGFEKRVIWEKALSEILIEREGKKTMSALKAQVIVGAAMTAFTSSTSEWFKRGGETKLRPIVKKAFEMVRSI